VSKAIPSEENNEAQEVGSSAWRGDVRRNGYPVKWFLHEENQKNDGGGGFSLKRRSLVFSIFVSVVIGCFLLEIMLQISITVCFGHTDFFPGITKEVLSRFGEKKIHWARSFPLERQLDLSL
jgi:hypothetical protein